MKIDDGEPKNVSLPTTFRGLLPTTHTISLSAPGYESQIFTLNVRSGQTTFATDIQLYQGSPFTTVRTGIPKHAILAPDGSAVAWLENQKITISDTTSVKHLTVALDVESLTWSESNDNLLLQNENQATLAIVSHAGILREKSYVLPVGNRPKIDQLLNDRMVYSAVQTIPGSTSWLLLDESSAWILQPNGDLTLPPGGVTKSSGLCTWVGRAWPPSAGKKCSCATLLIARRHCTKFLALPKPALG